MVLTGETRSLFQRSQCSLTVVFGSVSNLPAQQKCFIPVKQQLQWISFRASITWHQFLVSVCEQWKWVTSGLPWLINLMDGENKKNVFELCYSMLCPYKACDITGLFVIAHVFQCNYIFGDIFYYQYYNYCNCAMLVLVRLLFFQDSRCIVNVSNKTKMK